MQKKYAQVNNATSQTKAQSPQQGWVRYIDPRAYSPANRTMLLIGIGMVLQVSHGLRLPTRNSLTIQFICALVVFLVSRKFHPSFGVTGKQVTMGECRRGWEW
jgi:hypothetical protein